MEIDTSDRTEIEYHNGQPIAKVSPKRKHALVQGNLIKILWRCGSDFGEIGPEWRFDVGAPDESLTEYVPDVAFISNERLAALDDEAVEEPPGAPDIAVEIRSPDESAAYRTRKLAKYLACGASLALDVDPQTRTITAHDSQNVRRYTVGQQFAHPVFPWLHFDVIEAFAGLDRSRPPHGPR